MRILFILLVLSFLVFGCGRETTAITDGPALTTSPAPAAAPREPVDKNGQDKLRYDPSLEDARKESVGREKMAPVESMLEGTADPEDVARYSGARRPAASAPSPSTDRRASERNNRPDPYASSAKKGPVTIADITTPAVFEVSKTPCYGDCKQYSLTLHGNGLAVLNARKNLNRTGYYTTRLPPSEADKMTDLFRRVTAGGLQTVYPAGEVPADLPATKLEYAGANGLPQVVRVYSNAPADLQQLFDMAEQLVVNGDWQRAER